MLESLERLSVLLELPSLKLHKAFKISAFNIEFFADIGNLGTIWLFSFFCDYRRIVELCPSNNERISKRSTIKKFSPFNALLKMSI